MKPQRESRGLALITVLVLMVFIGLYIASVSATINQSLRSGPREEMLMRGQYAAEAGLNRALVELGNQDMSLPVDWPVDSTFEGEVTPGSSVGYRVVVKNNHGGDVVETAPDGTSIPIGLAWIQSTGLIDGQPIPGQSGMARRLAGQGTVEFQHVVRSDILLRFGAAGAPTVVSSFDSLGDPFPWTPTFLWNVASTHRTPSTTLRAETSADLRATQMDGHLIAATASTKVDENGGTYPSGATVVEDDPELRIPTRFRIPDNLEDLAVNPNGDCVGGLFSAGRYGNVTLNGTVTLERGEYYMDSLTVGNAIATTQVTLLPDLSADPQPCVIYVRNDVDVYTVLGSTNLAPKFLRLYFTDDETGENPSTFQVHANATFCGVACGEHLLTWATWDSTFIGAIKSYGRVYWDRGVNFLYDRQLRTETFEEQPEWILINETDD